MPGLDVQFEQSENDNPVGKKMVASTCKIHKLCPWTNILFFWSTDSLIRTYGLVVKVTRSRRESGDMGSIPAGC